jgi:murein DD-endopeptidase MepM/ murein hydrolase activator NlpD
LNREKKGFGPRLTSSSFFWAKRLIERPQLGEMGKVGTGAQDATRGKSGMAETLIERAWAWIHATFPERQIYIRSDGRVQFFTFGAPLQATLAGLSLIFLGWVAFASVNVIFKDRIIAAKDHRYQEMTSAYENRVADLQMSYDEVNGALVTAEDRFKGTADEFQAKQQSIIKLLNQKHRIDSTLASLPGAGVAARASAAGDDDDSVPSNGAVGSDSVGGGDLNSVSPDAGGSSELTVMPQSAAPQPRTARPFTKASMLDLGSAMQRIGALFRPAPKIVAVKMPKLPALRAIAQQEDRIRRMSATETTLLVGTENQIGQRVQTMENALRIAGVDPTSLEQQVASREGVGGPLIPLSQMRIEGISDRVFTAAYADALGRMAQLSDLFTGLRHVPLTTPVHGSQYEITSGFGARVDPFTRHYSFHPGIDFAGPWGSTIAATAPGTVVFAGPRGGYGNMVEIDHGFGIHTRYGHMSSILVQVGAKVAKGSPIGRLGSTGRSTGPHVHYEVWSNNVVRNPSKFIEAGRHVLQ